MEQFADNRLQLALKEGLGGERLFVTRSLRTPRRITALSCFERPSSLFSAVLSAALGLLGLVSIYLPSFLAHSLPGTLNFRSMILFLLLKSILTSRAAEPSEPNRFTRGACVQFIEENGRRLPRHSLAEGSNQQSTGADQIMREIRRRTRVVGAFPDGQSCLNLAAVRLRYIAGYAWPDQALQLGTTPLLNDLAHMCLQTDIGTSGGGRVGLRPSLWNFQLAIGLCVRGKTVEARPRNDAGLIDIGWLADINRAPRTSASADNLPPGHSRKR